MKRKNTEERSKKNKKKKLPMCNGASQETPAEEREG
jgi:hypothetical protein